MSFRRSVSSTIADVEPNLQPQRHHHFSRHENAFMQRLDEAIPFIPRDLQNIITTYTLNRFIDSSENTIIVPPSKMPAIFSTRSTPVSKNVVMTPAIGTSDISFLNAETNHITSITLQHKDNRFFECVAWLDNSWIATSFAYDSTSSIQIWHLPKPVPERILTVPNKALSVRCGTEIGCDIVALPQKHLASRSGTGVVLIWNWSTGECVRMLNSDRRAAEHLCLWPSNANSLVAKLSSGGSIDIWDWEAGKKRQTMRGLPTEVGLTPLDANRLIANSTSSCAVNVYDIRNPADTEAKKASIALPWTGHAQDRCIKIDILSSGRPLCHLASLVSLVWDIDSNEVLHTIFWTRSEFTICLPSGKLLQLDKGGREIHLLTAFYVPDDTKKKKPKRRHTALPSALAKSQSTGNLASPARSGSVMLRHSIRGIRTLRG